MADATNKSMTFEKIHTRLKYRKFGKVTDEHMIDFIKHSKEKNSKSSVKWTILHVIAKYGKWLKNETIQYVIDNVNANLINKKTVNGFTALMLACRHSNDMSSEAIVKILIANGANVNLQNDTGVTALHFAVANCANNSTLGTVKLLLDANCDVNLCEVINSITPLMSACEYSGKTSNNKAVKLLIEAKCDLNMINLDGETALMISMRNSNIKLANLLIDSGCNVNTRSVNGETPLTLALINDKMPLLFIDKLLKLNSLKIASKFKKLISSQNYQIFGIFLPILLVFLLPFLIL